MPDLRKLPPDDAERLCFACESFMDALAEYRGAFHSDDFQPFADLAEPISRFTVHPHYSHDWGAAARIGSIIMRLYAHGRTILSHRLFVRGAWRQIAIDRRWTRWIAAGRRAVRWIVREAEPASTLAHRLHGKIVHNGDWAMQEVDGKRFATAVDFVGWTHFAALSPHAAKQRLAARNDATHSPDYTSVVWYGTPYSFKKGQQADTVAELWTGWEAGTPRLSESTIGERIGSSADQFRLAHVFRGHPAYGTMIVSASKGVFTLNPPKNHT